MKKILGLLLGIIIVFQFVACNNNFQQQNDGEINVTLITPDGLPSIAISKTMTEYKKIGDMKMEYVIQKTPDLLLSELMKEEVGLAIVPSNLALQVYNKGLDYKVIGTVGWGSLYLVSTEDISSISEIKGKEVYNVGKGLTPDIVFRKVLNSNNIQESEVNFNYVNAASELGPLVLSGKVKYAVLPEPILSNVLEKNNDIKIICSLNDEWIRTTNVELGYPQSTLIIKSELYNKIKGTSQYDELIRIFTESEDWVINNPQLVIEKCEELGITVNRESIVSSISNSNLKFIEVKDTLDEYNTYFRSIDTSDKGEKNEYDSLFIKK